MMNRSKMVFVAALMAFAMTAAAFRAGAGMLDLQPQIDAAAARGGGVVSVPAGEREVMPFVLKSNVTLQFEDGAVLLASTNLADYSEIPERRCVIYAENATNVAIVGKGMVNGRGGVFKAQKIPLEAAPRDRPYMMNFTRCRNLRLEGFGFRDSGAWGIHLRNCDGVTVRGVTCISHSNRNNDGIDVESSNVLIEDCDIDSGDDAIVLKTESDKSFQVTNVVVRNCRLASRCNAFKFGTGSYNAFRDVLLENCRLERPKYFSARSRRGYYRNNFVPSLYDGGAPCGLSAIELAVVDGGSIENVTIRNIEIDGYLQAFHIRQHHRHEPEDGKVDTYLRNVLIENVKGTVDGRLASAITGVPAKDGAAARRPSDITLRNVHLTVLGGGTEEDAKRAVPEKDGAYPACWMFDKKPLPAYGFYVRHADNIVFDDVSIVPRRPDARPPFVFDDCTGCVPPKATKTDMIAVTTAYGAPFKMPDVPVWRVPPREFPITDYGAVTGAVKNTAAFAKAIEACSAAGGGRVVVPAGDWRTGAIHLKSNVALDLREGSRLVFTDDPADYLPAVHTNWEGVEAMGYSPLIYAFCCTNVAIIGKGRIAPETNLWRKEWDSRNTPMHKAFIATLYDWCSMGIPLEKRDITRFPGSHARPHLIQFNRSANILLEDFLIRGSPFWNIHLFHSENVVVRGIDIYSHGHNTDGIDIDMTKNVIVENCIFDQGDDAIVLKAARNHDAWRLGRSTENVVVRNCTVRNGHVLLGIGSDVSGGIRNVFMHDCRMVGQVHNVFYVKTNERRGGFVENIYMKDCSVELRGKSVPMSVVGIETDVLYEWRNLPTWDVRVTRIRNICAENVRASKARHLLMVYGDVRDPVDGVTLKNVTCGETTEERLVVVNAKNVTMDGVPLPSRPGKAPAR